MDADVVETHISRVFLTPERAYKMLKAVDAGFIDFTDTETRLRAAQREYELNRRIAPGVYLGTADVFENDELVDRMVVMRRMPEDHRLKRRLELLGSRTAPEPDAEPDADDLAALVSGCLAQVARVVATFHAGFEPLGATEATMAARDSVARHWEENFAAIDAHVGEVIDEAEFEAVRVLVRRYLEGSEALFAERIEQGWIRDGHGDLRAEDIFCTENGPQILDCLAFADEYRYGDVLADVGFLAMDVIHLAGQELADEFMAAYVEFTGESHPKSLAGHYIAYRAHVRVKIACLKAEQGDRSQIDQARELHRLAAEQLHRSKRRVVLVGGGPGTGKSTVSRAISDELGYCLCVSDEIRKDLAGIDHLSDAAAPLGRGIYDAETTDSTYAAMLEQARTLLVRGESVVLDASWSDDRHRELARSMAEACIAEIVEVHCLVDVAMARERVAQRSGDPSDATPEIVDALADAADPWPDAFVLDTSHSVEIVTAAAIREAGQ
ncbi:MAG: AAA family ATPase [Microthrixaceae bacterium]